MTAVTFTVVSCPLRERYVLRLPPLFMTSIQYSSVEPIRVTIHKRKTHRRQPAAITLSIATGFLGLFL